MQRDRPLIEGVTGHLRLFWGASPEALAAIAAQSWALPLARASSLVRRGERLPGLVAVAYGSVKLRIEHGGGKERVVRVVGAGDTFGESAALLGSPAPFEPVALAPSKLVVVPSVAILAAIERDARLARNLVMVLARRHLRLLEDVAANGPRRGVQRLASYLESLAEPAAGNGELEVRLPGTKTLAAAQLGMTKETLSRLLRSLAQRGVLRLSGRDIAIVDRGALSGLAAKRD